MKNYEPMEIIVRRPWNYIGNGNYEQKITVYSDKTEKEILEAIREIEGLGSFEVMDIASHNNS